MNFTSVVPMLEHQPERSYRADGAVVRCFSVIRTEGTVMNPTLILSDKPIFELILPSADLAQQLMEDLYYGEYEGG